MTPVDGFVWWAEEHLGWSWLEWQREFLGRAVEPGTAPTGFSYHHDRPATGTPGRSAGGTRYGRVVAAAVDEQTGVTETTPPQVRRHRVRAFLLDSTSYHPYQGDGNGLLPPAPVPAAHPNHGPLGRTG